MASVAEAFQFGIQLHQAGRLAEAERVYRQILAVEPDHAQALHHLGLVAAQGSHFEAAVELFSRAVRADRTQPTFHANLAEAYRHLDRPVEAEASFRHALKLEPRTPRVRTLLAMLLHKQRRSHEAVAELNEELRRNPEDPFAQGQLGIVLWDLDRLADAETCFRRAVHGEPRSADAHYRLGGALQQQDKRQEAALSYRAALELDPAHCAALNNLGTLLKDEGRFAEAADCFRRATAADPNYASAHLNLGLLLEHQSYWGPAIDSYRAAAAADPTSTLARYCVGAVLQQQEDFSEAATWYEDALRTDPSHVAARMSLGYVLKKMGQLEQAIGHWQEAAARDPQCIDAFNNLGVAWNELGNRQAAIENCRRAVELRPDFGAAHINLTVALLGAGQLDEAVEAGHQAIAVSDNPSQAHGNLANCYQTRGQLDEAIQSHRQAMAHSPGDAQEHSNLLYTLNYHPSVYRQQLADEHRAWGKQHADFLTASARPHINDRSPQRRLRVGYVSGQFRAHAVNAFFEPILASHDHSAVEVYCYANSVIRDETTTRLKGFADHWRDIVGIDDQSASELVRRDQIDVLVDLAGHISGNRLSIFARKPAPVQVTYLGYQNTTGMAAMDYRLTDAYSDPPGTTEAYYTETLVRLPRTFFVYLPTAGAPPVGELPAASRGHVTFGSFNHFAKVTPQVLTAWSQLLAAVPNSRLLILSHASSWISERITKVLAEQGVSPDRVELVPRRPYLQYLDLISQVDIALDAFPFNGHTTTCDCLWQGVPVVARAGDSYVSRFGSSGLITLGLKQLVANSVEQYIDAAARLAADLDGLRQLRSTMRERMQASPLMDFAGFTRDLEAAYRTMWQSWRQSGSGSAQGELTGLWRG